MKRFLFCIICCILLFSGTAHAFSIIRDAEVETLLLKYIHKNFEAAGLNPQNASVVIINDDSINAFVAGGQTIFVHSGLITHAKSPDDIVFVLAHETGHIVGGHVIRGMEELKKAQTTALISGVLGGLLATAGGRPDAGLAILVGTNSSAIGSFLAYRQTEESAADRTAVDIMKKTGYSLIGFTNTMKEIQNQERITTDPNGSYLNTHPLTRDRIQDMQAFTQNAPAPKQEKDFALAKAKITAFLEEPKYTRSLYTKETLAGRYALAIAEYRDNNITQSLAQIEELIKEEPKNPYFWELKGQFLFETGQLKQAKTAYEQAVKLSPHTSLIRLGLGQVLVELEEEDAYKQAITELTQVAAQDPDLPGTWRLLAIAYGRTDNIAMADYAMAEYYLKIGQTKEAVKLAKKAADKIPQNTPAFYHVQDILSITGKEK